MQEVLKLVVRNLHFTVELYDPVYIRVIEHMKTQLSVYSYKYDKFKKRLVNTLDATYYSYDPRTKEYRFPITVVKRFMQILGSNGITKEMIVIEMDKVHKVETLRAKVNPKYELRDYQHDYVNTALDNLDKKYLLIDAVMGAGKSLMMSAIWSNLNMRVGMIVLPKFIKKWIEDLKDYLQLEDEDFYVVQGSESLVALMEEQDIDYKVILFSMRTVLNYLKDYESGAYEYPVNPQDLFDHIGIGVLANDETHMEFQSLTYALTYFDADYFFGSTGTFDSNNKNIKRLYNLVIPKHNRISNLLNYDPYVNVKSIEYKLKYNKRIKYKRAQGYNHILYEHSIIKFPMFKAQYYKMIDKYINDVYFQKRKDPNDKIIIFFASVDMCSDFTEYLKNKYKDDNVYRYIGGDSYNTMLESNIIVSNGGMLGTAVDVKGLIAVIQTVSTSSLQSNLQNFGRLRKIPDREVWYYYIFTRNIPRQYHMHIQRYEAIQEKMAYYTHEEYPHELKT